MKMSLFKFLTFIVFITITFACEGSGNLALNGGQNALSMALEDLLLPEIRLGQWCDVGEISEMFFVIEFN